MICSSSISHNFGLEGPIPTIQTFFYSLCSKLFLMVHLNQICLKFIMIVPWINTISKYKRTAYVVKKLLSQITLLIMFQLINVMYNVLSCSLNYNIANDVIVTKIN